MLDNGAFSKWKSKKAVNWVDYYSWSEKWLSCPTTWAVIPDEIDAGSQMQDALISEWPHTKRQSAPVWHMDEPISRLLKLIDQGWYCVCIGSTGEYAVVLSEIWQRFMDNIWNDIFRTFGKAPRIHMLRGMQLSSRRWPFASVDSTDIAQNHHLPHNSARKMADRWNATQCPISWQITQIEQHKMDFAW
jgi:hypothetical protein